jgi:hypothetical protein
MNRDHVLFHLKEAAEELMRTIAQVEKEPDYTAGEFAIPMQHLYHHLNTAWNTRTLESRKIEMATDQDFNTWGMFPEDLHLMEV